MRWLSQWRVSWFFKVNYSNTEIYISYNDIKQITNILCFSAENLDVTKGINKVTLWIGISSECFDVNIRWMAVCDCCY